jgi:hypothetical protein
MILVLSKAQVPVVQSTTRILQILQFMILVLSKAQVPVVQNTTRADPGLPGEADVTGLALVTGHTAGIGKPGLALVTGHTAGIGKPAGETEATAGVDPGDPAQYGPVHRGARTGLDPRLLVREVMPSHCAMSL